MIVYLVHLDLVERSEYFNVFVQTLQFWDSSHGGRMMFLERQNNVGDEWTLGWQEGTRGFEAHSVPHLRILQTVLRRHQALI